MANGGGGIHKLRVPVQSFGGRTWNFSTVSATTQREQLSAGDIDRDGDRDLLLGTQWLRNDGSSWTPYSLFSTRERPDRNRLVDVNRDGRLDAVVGYEALSQGRQARLVRTARHRDGRRGSSTSSR